ncbi:MAG: hypothetical protein FWF59_14920 [Turicibacter sp.]|nr:hypothetical protein [Turicibacter sp.]
MFRQHQIVCENKRLVIYLFLTEQEVDLDTMKTIFSSLTAAKMQQQACQYLEQNNIRFYGTNIRVVYKSTIIRDFQLQEPYLSCCPQAATNVVNFK